MENIVEFYMQNLSKTQNRKSGFLTEARPFPLRNVERFPSFPGLFHKCAPSVQRREYLREILP